MKNLSLSIKMSVGFGLVILALASVGGGAYYSITGVNGVVQDLSGVHVPLLESVASIDSALGEQEKVVTQYALHKDDEFLGPFAELEEKVDQAIELTKKLIDADQELVDMGWGKVLANIGASHDAFVTSAKTLMAAIKAGKPYEVWDPLADDMAGKAAASMAQVDKLLHLNNQESEAVSSEASAMAAQAQWFITIAALAGILFGGALAVFITRSITGPLNRIIAQLSQGADQVASASGQVSSAGQSLAQGASEQAASLEETSSSLEEMASMAHSNTDNASQADNLMQEVSRVVGTAGASMASVKSAMAKITAASDETAKIIKTIDEIAFQTNLLALNAAVEAARAGEAGAGFAVVADEVRNLALRAAEAAKSTSDLIEGNLKNIKLGSELVAGTDEAFGQVEKSSAEVAELVAEIASASNEQKQGVDQINKATGAMDRVTQQVASNAEESAAAAEELSAQAAVTNDLVAELTSLVQGGGGKSPSNPARPQPQTVARPQRQLAAPPPATRQPARDNYASKAEEAIPFDDKEDFQDF